MGARALSIAVIGLIAAIAPARATWACDADLRAQVAGYDITGDHGTFPNFYDYGALFMDAGSASCRDAARSRLEQKLGNELARGDAFTGWLAGGEVYLVMATALRLRGAGLLTATLDSRVHAVGTQRYRFSAADRVCNGPSDNTCMEDYATAAAAYAWIAAYEGKTGRSPSPWADNARQNIDLAFSTTESVCVRSIADACNACSQAISADVLYDQIAAGQTEVLSYNGLVDPVTGAFYGENPNYGVGILTSVAAAVTGLKVIGQDWNPSPMAIVLGQGLVREAQRRIVGARNTCGVTWSSTCYIPYASCSQTLGCGDPNKGNRYNPAMYPIRALLDQKFVFTRAALYLPDGYGFACFDESFFSPADDFFNDARLAVYRDLASIWFANPPTFEPADTDPPRMWVDRPEHEETTSGLASFYGWAIDLQGPLSYIAFQIDSQYVNGFSYGGSRTDVCAYFGVDRGPGCPVGWGGTVNTQQYLDGEHSLTVIARDAAGNQSTYSRQFRVANGSSGGSCSANPPVGPSNINAFNAGLDDYYCGYYKYYYGYDPYGYCNQAVSAAAAAGIKTTATGTCTGGTSYNYNAGLNDYYCRYYEYYGYGWDYGSYCYWANYYASVGGCTGCGQASPPPCQGTAHTIWIQPQARAGFGPPGSLVLAGSASASGSCGSGGVDLYWRAPGGSWQHVPYSAPVGSDGIWYNSIENANPYATYETYVTYQNGSASYCTYDGRNDIVWCP